MCARRVSRVKPPFGGVGTKSYRRAVVLVVSEAELASEINSQPKFDIADLVPFALTGPCNGIVEIHSTMDRDPVRVRVSNLDLLISALSSLDRTERKPHMSDLCRSS